MQRIVFVNKEQTKKKWIIPLFKYILMFIVLVVLGITFFLCGKSTMIGGMVFVCNAIIIPILNRELRQWITIDVYEALEQTENGICIAIPKIRRGNYLTEHAERLIWDRERVHLIMFHTKPGIVDIVGHPVIHIIQDGKEKVGDTYETQPEEYVTFHIHCTEENRDEILELLQTALQREVERRAS